MRLIWLDYLMFLVPGVALTLWAQGRIMRAYAAASRLHAGSGLTGAEAAQLVMRAGGVLGVGIEPGRGELSDHYAPSDKVLRLSREVYAGHSLAALGVAAHEAGHAIQDAAGYPGLVARSLIVPLAALGSQVFWLLIAAGLIVGWFRLVILGIIVFSLVVLLQLLNLPVEFDASRRGREFLRSAGLVTVEEEPAVARVLNAAAWTYVATALTGAVMLLYYPISQFGLLGGRRSDD
jgi:Zn-dependent membrane protease YugP